MEASLHIGFEPMTSRLQDEVTVRITITFNKLSGEVCKSIKACASRLESNQLPIVCWTIALPCELRSISYVAT